MVSYLQRLVRIDFDNLITGVFFADLLDVTVGFVALRIPSGSEVHNGADGLLLGEMGIEFVEIGEAVYRE